MHVSPMATVSRSACATLITVVVHRASSLVLLLASGGAHLRIAYVCGDCQNDGPFLGPLN